MRRAVLLLLARLLAPVVAQAQRCTAPLPPGAGIPATDINPVTLRVFGAPIMPAPATDGRIHLAYAAEVVTLSYRPHVIGHGSKLRAAGKRPVDRSWWTGPAPARART